MKGWRTIAINVLSLAGLLFASDPIYQFISPEHAAEVLAVANVLLRCISTTPVGSAAPRDIQP